MELLRPDRQWHERVCWQASQQPAELKPDCKHKHSCECAERGRLQLACAHVGNICMSFPGQKHPAHQHKTCTVGVLICWNISLWDFSNDSIMCKSRSDDSQNWTRRLEHHLPYFQFSFCPPASVLSDTLFTREAFSRTTRKRSVRDLMSDRCEVLSSVQLVWYQNGNLQETWGWSQKHMQVQHVSFKQIKTKPKISLPLCHFTAFWHIQPSLTASFLLLHLSEPQSSYSDWRAG